LKTILGVSATPPIPSLTEILPQLAVFLLTEDALHYALHRLLHTPYLYKTIHKVHHHHPAPFGFSAYAHPIEVFALAIPTYSGLLFVRPHLFTFYLWIFIRQLDSLDTHCGYEFPWHPHRLIPFWGGAPFHDYHHAAFTGNFASRFTYLDKLLGTYKEMPLETLKSGKAN
jgi:sterol desaturase/sphingolipid hydroxylase (fatty acid hydroxylase superfamily)